MQKTIVLGFALAVGLVPVSASAQVFEAVNKLKVVALNASDFEVIEARGEGPRGLWCAAADYAQARYGGAGQQRIYVKTPRGAAQSVSGRKGVVFTVDANRVGAAPQQSLSVTVRTPGVNLSRNHSIQFCKDYTIEIEDVLYPLKKR